MPGMVDHASMHWTVFVKATSTRKSTSIYGNVVDFLKLPVLCTGGASKFHLYSKACSSLSTAKMSKAVK